MILHQVLPIIFLLAASALFSGLTLGLMGLDSFELHRKSRLGNKDAKRIYKVRKDGNLLLCTLLIGNVAVNAALSIFLNTLFVGLIAGFISTALIVVLGEIAPQAIFSKHALKLGAKTVWIIYPALIILYPVTKPLALLLDWTLGKELPTIYPKKEFHLLIKDQKRFKAIKDQEFRLLEAGLFFSEKQVKDVMTPLRKTYMLSKNAILGTKTIKQINDRGHSRIPVYERYRSNIVALLYAKDLINLDPGDNIPLHKKMRTKSTLTVDVEDRLDKVLHKFKSKRTHIFLVKDDDKVMGIITLEDVLEEIVGNIIDEYDHESPVPESL